LLLLLLLFNLVSSFALGTNLTLNQEIHLRCDCCECESS